MKLKIRNGRAVRAQGKSPGFYLLTKDVKLSAGAPKAGYRKALPKGTYLVTDGYSLAVFDMEEFDWLPLEWIRGAPITTDQVGYDLFKSAVQLPPAKAKSFLEKRVNKVYDPGEEGKPFVAELPNPKSPKVYKRR